MMLETIWFILWGVLWAVYFILDGYDLGMGSLMPFLAKSDKEKQIISHDIGRYWDGNEVWLITAGGVTFAAFPTAYAVMFSSLYSALMLLLFGLIFRGVAVELRSHTDSPGGRRFWDACLTVGSFLPALLLGVAFANIFRGIPLDSEGHYQGTLLTLLNPFGLLGGALFVLLFLVHGALWLAIKAEGALEQRAASAATKLWPLLLGVAVVFLAATWFATNLYINYMHHPVLWIIIAVTVAALVMVRVFLTKQSWGKAWVSSAVAIGGATAFGIAGLYPALLPSSIDPAYSLTIHNSASSPLTLKIMLGVALFFVPIVIVYQIWALMLFKDKVPAEHPADSTLW